MLTRLKVSGFKNLMDVDVRFGPFTCIAGANGVGKSNLFDAIRFLAALADTNLLEAALSVRAEGQRAADVRGLFHRAGSECAKMMSFEVEMIVPPRAVDDFGQEGQAKITILRYKLQLGYRDLTTRPGSLSGELEVLHEELTHLQKGDMRKHLLFESSRAWRDSAVVGACRTPLISTTTRDGARFIKLHQDGRSGRASEHAASTLPRTILSSGSANESPTVLCARREMGSWRLLQLEPAALRSPSQLRPPTQVGTYGANLAAAPNHATQHTINAA